jgi:hypothetical protein
MGATSPQRVHPPSISYTVDGTSLHKEKGNVFTAGGENAPSPFTSGADRALWSDGSAVAILPKSRAPAPRPVYTAHLDAYFPVFFSLILAAATMRG